MLRVRSAVGPPPCYAGVPPQSFLLPGRFIAVRWQTESMVTPPEIINERTDVTCRRWDSWGASDSPPKHNGTRFSPPLVWDDGICGPVRRGPGAFYK